MKYYLLSFILTFSLIFNSNSYADQATDFLIDRMNATKLLLIPPRIVKEKIAEAKAKIKDECCEENFSKISKINEIKDNLQKCLDKKCHAFNLPIYTKKKPPLKLIVMRQLDELDDLIIENNEKRYENLTKKLEIEKNEIKLNNEQDIEKLKNQNSKLKETVDKILKKYQEKISKLEKENKKLSDNFNLVFEAHPPGKQKKLEKELK